MEGEFRVAIEKSWKEALGEHLGSEDFKSLAKFVKEEYKTKKIYPEAQNIFRALSLTPLENVKVVILGQDPYVREGESDGLCFSVSAGYKIPAGLRNIFKEVSLEFGEKSEAETKSNGDLSSWAKQVVLLLNSILTVEDGKPGSHKNIGWEDLTDEVIRKVSDKGNVVFLLWGSKAKDKLKLIDQRENLVLTSNHPSQPSRNGVFAGNRHFRKANEWLRDHGQTEIIW